MFRHRIVVTGGGTGGHIYPALAICDLLKDDPEVEALLYVGAIGHLEEKLAKERELQFLGLEVSALPRKASADLLRWSIEFGRAVMQVREFLRRFRPTIVIGTGGYASAPPVVAALTLGVPYALHEPDAHPGLVNRTLSPYANLVSLGMEGAIEKIKKCRGKIVVNGNPVGQKFLHLMRRDSACAVLGLDPQLKTLLITGGSQGAASINEAILAALPELLAMDPPIQVIHQVGEKNLQSFRDRIPPEIRDNKRYLLRAYFEDLSLVYATSDLAICRAGAITIAELAVTGTPAIFIPLPPSVAAADHQTHNAMSVATKGAAIVIPQSTVTEALLVSRIKELLNNEEQLRSMHDMMLAIGKPNAAADLASQIKEVSAAHQVLKRAPHPLSPQE